MKKSLEIRRPEIVKEIIGMRIQGKSASEIQRIVREKYKIDVSPTCINSIIRTELQKIGSSTPDKDCLVDRDEILKKIIQNKAEKIEMLVEKLDEMILKIDWYKQKIFRWLDRLERDLDEYYLKIKTNDKVTVEDINEIKESVMKSMNLVTAGVNELIKLLEIHTKMLELTRPAEVRINKIDMILKVTQVTNNIEKLGYCFVKADPELIKRLEKEGKIKVFRRI